MQQLEQLAGLTMSVEQRPPNVVVLLHGELDECNIARVAVALDTACDSTAGDMLLDVGALEFLGVSGAALLSQVDRRLALEGRRLVVEHPTRAVSQAMQCVGASRRRPIRPVPPHR